MTQPKNLNSRKYHFSRVTSEPDPFTPEEFKNLSEHCSERFKLYLQLMLSCGFQQADLSAMTADEIDWTEGRIIRARTKKTNLAKNRNGRIINIFKVNRKLWEETFQLLKKYGNRDGLVFTQDNGDPLMVEKISTNGKYYTTDSIADQYRQLQKTTNTKKQLKQLRKTGASYLATSEHHQSISHLLDHDSLQNKHYIKSGQILPELDRAVEYLGDLFGIK